MTADRQGGQSSTGGAESSQQAQAEAWSRQSERLQAMAQLGGAVAHELNNLLMTIQGNLGMLKARLEGSANLREMVALVEDATRRAAELTSDLLAFEGRRPLRPQLVDIDRLLADMADGLRRTLGEAVELAVGGGAGLWSARVDAAALESAIANLAVNAREAMPSGGRITIETAALEIEKSDSPPGAGLRPGRYVMLTVTDSGIGMTPEVAQRAFEPFFTTKPRGSRAGFGLSAVYGFARQSGGDVVLESAPGRGTSVRLYLPAD